MQEKYVQKITTTKSSEMYFKNTETQDYGPRVIFIPPSVPSDFECETICKVAKIFAIICLVILLFELAIHCVLSRHKYWSLTLESPSRLHTVQYIQYTVLSIRFYKHEKNLYLKTVFLTTHEQILLKNQAVQYAIDR